MKDEKKASAFDTALDRTSRLVAVVVGLCVIAPVLYTKSPFLPYWVFWFVVFCYVTIGLAKQSGKKMNIVRRCLIIAIIIGALTLCVVQILHYETEMKAVRARAEFEKMLAAGKWIAYEPAALDPYIKAYPTAEQIRRDLRILAEGGFDSLITFSAAGSLQSIPHIAKELGFKAVIMGIINVADPRELAAAIAVKTDVQAYCVGHMFTDYPYSEAELLSALAKVRTSTCRPVTTTLRPNGYLVFPNVSREIDFFFPDVHTNWYSDGRATTALQNTKSFVDEVRKIQENYPNKPILLKMISIPSRDVPGASTREQFLFYRGVVQYIKSCMTFPERIYPSYFSAFDLNWKSSERGWPPGERYVGLYDASGVPKVAEISGRLVRVVDALKWSRIAKTPVSNAEGVIQR